MMEKVTATVKSRSLKMPQSPSSLTYQSTHNGVRKASTHSRMMIDIDIIRLERVQSTALMLS